MGRGDGCPTQVHEQGDDRYEDELARNAREQRHREEKGRVVPELAEQAGRDVAGGARDQGEHQEPPRSQAIDKWAEGHANQCRDETQRAGEVTVLRGRQADLIDSELWEHRHRNAIPDAVHELDSDEKQAHGERQDAKEVPEDADDIRVGHLPPRRSLARHPGQCPLARALPNGGDQDEDGGYCHRANQRGDR